MTLTVPRATDVAGAVPHLQAAPASQLGAGLAELGGQVEHLAATIIGRQVQGQIDQQTLALTTDFQAARQQVAQITDPAQIGPAWDQAAAAIQEKYLGEGDGTVKRDPRLTDALTQAFNQLFDNHTVAIAGQQIDMSRSTADAGWMAQSSRMATQAVTADDVTMKALMDQGLKTIDNRLAAGLETPASAEAARQKFKADLLTPRADALIAEDPQAFLDQAQKGIWNDIGADPLKSRMATAQSELARRAAEAAKNAEATQKQTDAALKTRLNDMADILGKNRSASDEALLTDPGLAARAAANPDVAEALAKAQAARDLRDEQPGLRMMTIPELQALRDQEAKRPIGQPWDAKRLDVIDGILTAKRTGYATDPMATAQAEGLIVPDLPAFDAENPMAYALRLAERMTIAGGMLQEQRASTFAPLTNADLAAIKPVLDPKADVGPKLALAQALVTAAKVAGGKGNAGRLAPYLGADPTMAWATGILATTGNAPLAESILRGQQKAALGTVTMPPAKDVTAAFAEATAGMFDGTPGVSDQIRAAATALYADTTAGQNTDGTLDAEAYARAVAQVTGASPDASGNLTIGGIQDVNGRATWLPAGVGRDQLDNAISQIGYGLDYLTKADNFGTPAGLDPWAPLLAASINGSRPDLGQNPSDWWHTVTFQRVGQSNTYDVFVTIGGQPHQLYQQGTQTAWQIDMNRLLAAVPK